MASPSLFRRLMTAAFRRSPTTTIRKPVRPLGRYLEQLDDRIVPTSDFGFAFQMGGLNADGGRSVATDSAGNVYVTGHFNGQFGAVDFDPAPDPSNPDGLLGSAGFTEIFVAKYKSDGAFVWAKHLGGSGGDEGLAIAVDSSGNVYTTGRFQGTSPPPPDFNPGPGTAILNNADGNVDIFVSKLDSSGNFVWAKQFGGGSEDQGQGIAVDSSGNVYTTGYFSGNSNSPPDFDPGPGTAILNNAEGSVDIFVSKLDSSGNFVWAKQLGGTGAEKGYAVTVDSSGNVYTTGYFSGTADFDPGPNPAILTSGASQDVFVSKLDPSGNFVWAKQFSGNSFNAGRGIAVDSSGNIYTTGYFDGSPDFDPGPNPAILNSAGSVDVFVSKMNSSGNFVWAKRLGGTGSDEPSGIALDSSGNIYTTGYFTGTADFDPGPGTSELASADGGYDVFVSKLDASGNFVSVDQLGGTRSDRAYGIALDSSGNVYTTGEFAGTADFDPGPNTANLTSPGPSSDHFQVFVSKLHPPATPPDTTGAHITAVESLGTTANTFNKVRITFSEAIDSASFTEDMIGTAASPGTLTGPNGLIPVTAIFTVAITMDTFEVTFPPQSTPGDYSIRIRNGILDLAGNLMDANQNGINGEAADMPAGDQFIATATLSATSDTTGAHVVSATFSGTAPSTFDKVRVVFSEAIDASSFTSDQIGSSAAPATLTGANGSIAVTAVTPVAGTTDTFDVTFAPQSTPGDYSIRTRIGILDLAGNPMDANQNGTNGEVGDVPAGDHLVTTATLSTASDTTGARITTASFTGATASYDKVTLTFNEAMQPATVNATNITLAGPGGAITFTNITPVAGSNNTKFDLTFASQNAVGDYTLNAGVDILDVAGNQMNQNAVAPNGESGTPPTGDQFSMTAALGTADTTGPRIITGGFGGSVANSFDAVVVTFNEAIDPATFDQSDVVITGPSGTIPVTGVTPDAGTNGTRFSIAFNSQTTAGNYQVTVGPDVRDSAGNQMDQNGVAPNGQAGVAPAGDQFSVSQTLTGGGGDDSFEENDTQGTAPNLGTLTSTRTETGLVLEDDDWYRFTTTATGTTSSSVRTNFTNAQGDIDMVLLDSTSTQVGVSEGSSDQELISLDGLPAGTYFLKVFGYNGATNPNYSLTITPPTGQGTTPRIVAIGQSDGSVKIIDGNSNEVLVPSFRPLDANGQLYQSTLAVALGDLDNDNIPELYIGAQKRAGIAGLDASKAGKVFVYSVANIIATGSTTPLDTITPFETNFDRTQTYETGFELAVGDVNGDGVIDLIAGSRGDVGQISVVSGAGVGVNHAPIGGIVTPFGTNYRGKVTVAAGNFIAETGTQNDEVAAARGNTDSPDPSQTGSSTRVAMFDFVGSALSPITFLGAISPEGIPSHIEGAAGQVIDRNAFVASINISGTGPDLLLFAARDFVSNSANPQIRVAVYGVNASGIANVQSSDADGDGGSFLAGNQVGSYALARSDIDGNGADSLALIVDGPSAGVLYLAPLTGDNLGGLTTAVRTGGVRITSS